MASIEQLTTGNNSNDLPLSSHVGIPKVMPASSESRPNLSFYSIRFIEPSNTPWGVVTDMVSLNIEELLLELASRYTLLVVSHSLNQARRLARQMFVLREGGQVEAVDKEALVDKDRLLALMDELF